MYQIISDNDPSQSFSELENRVKRLEETRDMLTRQTLKHIDGAPDDFR